jgi:hypothetical protein
MEHRFLVSVDKSEVWERHSQIKFIGLFNTIHEANNYIKTQKDFDRHTIQKIPIVPKDVSHLPNFADFGNKMIYNLKTKEYQFDPRQLYPLTSFNIPEPYNFFESKLYDISIVIPKRAFTKAAIFEIESSKTKLLTSVIDGYNYNLMTFFTTNLLAFKLHDDYSITFGIIGNDQYQKVITKSFNSFQAMFSMSKIVKKYESKPDLETLIECYNEILSQVIE